ncbi:hypothetical protein [Roseovarius sp. D0-M9]|uniref:hypothetical protein n=1 Tax=Roseovarius sp. D0-M9 TaxID=3127117 RepID=UPI00300FA986
MMPLVQVIWLGLSAGLFAIWICLLASLGRTMRGGAISSGSAPAHAMRGALSHPAPRATLGHLAGLTATLLTLAGLGLLLWPP